jgi:hypothetical protein
MPGAPPALSVVLATDCYDTIRPVVERLRAQTVRERIEVVIAGPDRRLLEPDPAELDGFAGFRIVEAGPLDRLSPVRASAVRAASAPIVFLGETHSYPHPDWAETLLRTHADGWTGVAPGVGNANPENALSWGIFLLDYGRSLAGLPAHELTYVPTHNASFARGALLDLGPALDSALSYGLELGVLFRSLGHRSYFEPAARIDHVNISRPVSAWAHERYLTGRLLAEWRCMRWSYGRRLLYVAGSPLIPAVLVWRIINRFWRAHPRPRVPVGAAPALVIGAVISAVGEAVGYIVGNDPSVERAMYAYEIDKLRYTSMRAG